MISVDLSADCEAWIYDPNGSGIQGSVFEIHAHVWLITLPEIKGVAKKF